MKKRPTDGLGPVRILRSGPGKGMEARQILDFDAYIESMVPRLEALIEAEDKADAARTPKERKAYAADRLKRLAGMWGDGCVQP